DRGGVREGAGWARLQRDVARGRLDPRRPLPPELLRPDVVRERAQSPLCDPPRLRALRVHHLRLPRTGMKAGIEDLAVLGGTPAFEEPLHVGYPNVGSRKALSERLDEILDRNWLTNDGPVVAEFERRLAEELSVENVVATCNGTSALELLLD